MNTRHILLALCIAASSTVIAQGTVQPATQDNAAARMQARHDTLVKVLDLSPEQSEQLMQIEERRRQGAMELSKAGLDAPTRSERSRALREAREAEIKALLTEEQYRKYQAFLKEKRDATIQRQQQKKATHQE